MDIDIVQAKAENSKEVSNLFSTVISHTFKKEKIFNPIELQNEIIRQIINFRRCLEDNNDVFLVAKYQDTIVATVSFGVLSDIVKENTDIDADIIELKSVYVLPEYHGNGIGSKIYAEALKRIQANNIKEFCLDSGYQSAQIFWESKLGKPYKTLMNFWGKNLHHKIWLVKL